MPSSQDRKPWSIVACQSVLFTVLVFVQKITGNDNKATTDTDAGVLNTWQSNAMWNCNTPPVETDFAMAPYTRHIDGGHRILLHGGSMGEVRSKEEVRNSDETWVYSVETNVWSNVTDEDPKPSARQSHAMVTLCNNIVILFGGKNDKNEHLNDTWLFETDTLKWRQPHLSPASQPVPSMFTHAAVAINSSNQTSCQCQQSVLVIPGPGDNALNWSTVWELVCVEDNKVYQWSEVKTKQKTSTPKGKPWLATSTGESETGVIVSSKNGLWTYRPAEKTWVKIRIDSPIRTKTTAIAVYFPFLRSYVIITDKSYVKYNITSGILKEEENVGQTSVSTRGGKAVVFGTYAIVHRGAMEACRQSMLNLTRNGDKWLAYRLPDSLLTPVFGYHLVLGQWRNNFYVVGTPTEFDQLSFSRKSKFWKLNLAQMQWFQLDNSNIPPPDGRKSMLTNSVFLQSCACFLVYRRRFPKETYVYYPDADTWNCSSFEVAPSARKFNSFVAFNSSAAVLFGGRWDSKGLKLKTLDDLWMLSFLAGKLQWHQLEPSSTTNSCLHVRPKPRAQHAAAVIDQLLLIYGGVGDKFSLLTDMWSYNVTDNCWTEIEQTGSAPVILSRAWKMSAVVVGPHMLVTVGCANSWHANEDYCRGEEQQSTWMYDSYVNKWTLLSITRLLGTLFSARQEIAYQSNIQYHNKRLWMLDNRELSLLYSFALACPPGHVSSDFVSTRCSVCSPGTYSDERRKTCIKCPDNLTTPSRSSTHVGNCSQCVDGHCRNGDCIVTIALDKPTPSCRCHFGFTGDRCQCPTYIVLGLLLIVVVALISLFAAYCINKWKHKQRREVQLQRSVEELTSVWQIEHNELQVLDQIGEGGYGRVHKAFYREFEVAVKLLKDVQPDHYVIDEFEREILFVQTVRHPNIVMFIGAGLMDDGSRFFVTEFMHRGSLRDVLETNKQTGIELITQIEFAIDAAKGMDFLHGLTPARIHRDLKSQNLLVSRTWTVKVSDFGLGRQILTENASRRQNSSITSPLLGNDGSMCTTRVGTLQWRAPEIATSQSYGTSADTYRYSHSKQSIDS